MTNIIAANLSSIKKRHYAQKATSGDYWVAFYKTKMDEYLEKFGEDFNLIIYGKDDSLDDFVSIPYTQLKDFLTEGHIDETNRRWVFSIDNENLRVHQNVKRLNITEFRGNSIDIPEMYQYSPLSKLNEQKKEKETAFEKEISRLSQEDLEDRIRTVDRRATYKEGTVKYYRRKAIVAEFARRRAEGRCQLCNLPAPFTTENGKPYLESHHVQWLSRGGYDSPENTSALCPNYHRKMHVLNLVADREIIL